MEVIFSDFDELKRVKLDGILEIDVNIVIRSYKRCPYTGLLI
ncbi:hypothetical protein ACFL0D_00950 [Thermoproteota archaeon]